MKPDRWHQISQVLDGALALDETQRAAFLRDACAGDEALRREVSSLLDHRKNAEGFLETPAFAVRLPRPRPRAPWWIHICAASFLGYFALMMFSTVYPPAGMGVRVAASQAEGLIVASVIPDFEADRAGVQPGDRLVAINGRPLRNVWEYSAFSASTSVGEERAWLFERSGREFSVTAAPARRQFFPLLRFLPVHLGLFASLVFAFVVIYIRPEDRVARLGALLLASMACAVPPPGPVGFAGTWRHLPAIAGALLWPACLSSIAAGAIAFSFFAVFPRRVIRRRWIWIAALMPAAVVTVWVAAYLMLLVYQPERAPDLLNLPGWLAIAGFSTFPAYFAAAIAMLVWSSRKLTDANERRRLRVLLIGITAAGIGLFYVAAPIVIMILGRGSDLLFLFAAPTFFAGPLFVALPCSLAYAIVAQRLFDIRIIIRQGLQYALARRSILSLVPALAAGLVVDLVVHAERPLVEIVKARGWVYATLAGLAVVAYRNRDGWMALLDRRFFRERYDAHQLLREVIEDVRAAATLDTAAPLVVTRVSAAFHPTFVALLVSEPHQRHFHVLAVAPDRSVVPPLTRDSKVVGLVRVLGKPIDFSSSAGWLDHDLAAEDAAVLRGARADLVAPIVTAAADQREALLVLGTKRSEEPYDRNDRELVTSVAASLAMLLERRPEGGQTDDAFVECPQCGVCEGVSATRCPEDGTPLVRVSTPRVLGGRYTIHRRLGRGGMGSVYEARDGSLERSVAVKVIRDDLVGSPEAAERFRQEALVAASFAHPNVVTVYDFGITDTARGYLVMERLDGTTLRETLQREGCLTLPRTLHVMRGVCQGVDAAHRRELVHRDLKPDNIFLTTDDVPKVLDFGVAKFVRPAADTIALTATGALIGTLAYMSPEQIRGGPPSPSWDLWALAVVACEMLAGARPFAEMGSVDWTVAAARRKILTGGQPELPASLDSVFARAFSLDPAERPAGALAFLASLERAFVA